MNFKFLQKVFLSTLLLVFLALPSTASEIPSWNSLLRKYGRDKNVRTVIFVQHTGGSNAQVLLYGKSEEDAWTLLLQCEGFVGKNGLSSDRHEGDGTTPMGDFGVIEAIGIKKNPASKIPYRTADKDLFCGSDEKNYNTIVSKRQTGHVCDETCAHIYDTSPQFNYAIFLDFNKERIMGKGSGIFLHCAGPNSYTAGCVAVSEENMKRILQLVDKNVRICIFPK